MLDNPQAPIASAAAYSVLTQLRTLLRLGPRELARLLFDAYGEWSSDNAGRLGAALAYYTLFSLAPVLIIVSAVVGLVFGRAAASGEVAPWLERFVGPDGARGAELLLSYSANRTQGTVTAVVGIGSLFFAASTLVSELRQSLNIVWKVVPAAAPASVLQTLRVMFVDRLRAVAVVIGAGGLIVVSVLVNAIVAAAGKYAAWWLPMPGWLLQGMNFAIALAFMTVTFALLYKAVPDAYVSWGDAFVGALLTALLFQAGTLLLSIFIGRAAGSVYGSAASILALLAWVYYSAQVFFFGAEAARLFANRFGGGIVPARPAVL